MHFNDACIEFVLARLLTILSQELNGTVKKIPPEVLWQFFQNGWEFFDQILHAYYAFLSIMLDYIFYSIICNFDKVMLMPY